MIKAVIFDMYETLITLFNGTPYFGTQMAIDAGISEEAEVIKNSELFPYFDAAYLSFEQGLQKPEEEIFIRCMNKLSVSADECLYVGDGGSLELETASKIGMKAVQAVWYLKEGTSQPATRKNDFIQAETPLEILKYI